MTETFQLLGVTFHWYGLIVGLAVVVSWQIFEQQLVRPQIKVSQECLSNLMMTMLAGALVGARLWHVVTDWGLYISHPWKVFFLWEGGLSIIGAVIGMIGAVWIALRQSPACQKLSFLVVTDALAFALPLGQAIGRLGNWVNQELYGLPTNLPWKIYIEPSSRISGYEQIAYYHPLYLYEVMLWFILFIILWLLRMKTKIFSVSNYPLGSGLASAIYLTYFCLIRFGLEFLRLEKPLLTWNGLSINQILMIAILPFTVMMIHRSWQKRQGMIV